MDQSEFSVAGATGNSNAFVTVSSAVPFFSISPPVSSHLFLLAPVSLRCERTLSTDQKGTACSLSFCLRLQLVSYSHQCSFCVSCMAKNKKGKSPWLKTKKKTGPKKKKKKLSDEGWRKTLPETA